MSNRNWKWFALLAPAVVLPAVAAAQATTTISGCATNDILSENDISDFGNTVVWNDDKRTCFANRTPAVSDQKIAARHSDAEAEQATNITIPEPN